MLLVRGVWLTRLASSVPAAFSVFVHYFSVPFKQLEAVFVVEVFVMKCSPLVPERGCFLDSNAPLAFSDGLSRIDRSGVCLASSLAVGVWSGACILPLRVSGF